MPQRWSALLLLVLAVSVLSHANASALSDSPPGVAEAADDWDALDADDLAAIACPGLPPSPERATFDFDDCRDMAAGEECEADCLDENDDGVVVATCNADGTFAINGSCTPGSPDRAGARNRCRRRPRVANASFRCGRRRYDTDVCTGKCRRAFAQRGDLSSTCSVPSWGAVSGTCLRRCRGRYRQPANGALDCAETVAGETCQGTCNAGYGPDSVLGGPELPCNARGRWQAMTGACVPVCKAADLPAPPPNSAWPGSGCDNVFSGTTCTASCNANYAGTVTSTCTNGVWGPVEGTCILSVCLAADLPAAPANSAWPVGGCDNASPGSTCTAPCNTGFSGTVTSTCNSGSPSPSWGPVSGTCVQQCTTAPPPQNNATFTSCTNRPDGNECNGNCISSTGPGPVPPKATCNAGVWTVTGGCLAGCGGFSAGSVSCPGGNEGFICPSTCPNGWGPQPPNGYGQQLQCRCTGSPGSYSCGFFGNVFCTCQADNTCV